MRKYAIIVFPEVLSFHKCDHFQSSSVTGLSPGAEECYRPMSSCASTVTHVSVALQMSIVIK